MLTKNASLDLVIGKFHTRQPGREMWREQTARTEGQKWPC